jgi:hypothetical protein
MIEWVYMLKETKQFQDFSDSLVEKAKDYHKDKIIQLYLQL